MKLLELKDILTYKASEQSDIALGDDLRIVASFYSTLKRTGKFKYTEEEIFAVAKDIIGELLKRGKIVFHPENWEEYSSELYSKVFINLKREGIDIPDNVAEHLREAEEEIDSVAWGSKLMSKETNEELVDRLEYIFELWVSRGKSDQDSEVVNAYILLTAELDSRDVEYEPVKELAVLAGRLEEGVRPAFGSPGGKRNIAAAIIPFFPDHKTYIEPFVGGGAMFFRKNPSEKEYINDLDDQIHNAYVTLKNEKPADIIETANKMDWVSSEERVRKAWGDNGSGKNSFLNFLYGIRGSFSCSRKSIKRTDVGKSIKPNFSTYESIHERLSNVHITKKDYRDLNEYDSKDSFYYLDPPYPGEWPRDLKTATFKLEEFVSWLKNLKGKFMVSINKENGKYFENNGWHFKDIPRLTMFSNSKMNSDPTKRKMDVELIITNYEMEKNDNWLAESYMDKKKPVLVLTDSTFPLEVKFSDSTYKLICTKNGGLVLNKD